MSKQNKLIATEAQTIRAIIGFLEAKGIMYIRYHPVRLRAWKGKLVSIPVNNSQRGAPDLFIFSEIIPVIACEVKSPSGKVSEDQVEWGNKWIKSGRKYLIARCVEDVERFLKYND